MSSVFGLSFLWFLIVISWILTGFKGLLLAYGIFALLMYINVVTTTLCNALTVRTVDNKADIFWKIYFIVISSISFGIYFSV